MKKIRDGKSGEITAEIFETLLPDKPEVFLLDFLRSEHEEIICAFKLNETDVGITRIDKVIAQRLLDEFKLLRGTV